MLVNGSLYVKYLSHNFEKSRYWSGWVNKKEDFSNFDIPSLLQGERPCQSSLIAAVRYQRANIAKVLDLSRNSAALREVSGTRGDKQLGTLVRVVDGPKMS